MDPHARPFSERSVRRKGRRSRYTSKVRSSFQVRQVWTPSAKTTATEREIQKKISEPNPRSPKVRTQMPCNAKAEAPVTMAKVAESLKMYSLVNGSASSSTGKPAISQLNIGNLD